MSSDYFLREERLEKLIICQRLSKAPGLNASCSKFQILRSYGLPMSVPKLTEQEVVVMDDMQKEGKAPQEILAKLQNNRARRGGVGPGHAAVYNFLSGKTHRRDASEIRGRPSKLPPRLVPTAVRVRKSLIQKAQNQYLVTWEDVHTATTRRATRVTSGKQQKQEKIKTMDLPPKSPGMMPCACSP